MLGTYSAMSYSEILFKKNPFPQNMWFAFCQGQMIRKPLKEVEEEEEEEEERRR